MFFFPNLFHDDRGNYYRRDRRPRGHYYCWTPIRRLIPGIWICWGQDFLFDDFGFYPGKVKS
jgi:hypothetical protein